MKHLERGSEGTERNVTPFVGVWIETWSYIRLLNSLQVTPFVGVWIETGRASDCCCLDCVTPFVGVWIETSIVGDEPARGHGSHPSWVCGLKLGIVHYRLDGLESHPSWVCGLKLGYRLSDAAGQVSHPSWVCGLKPVLTVHVTASLCHTLRGCVD